MLGLPALLMAGPAVALQLQNRGQDLTGFAGAVWPDANSAGEVYATADIWSAEGDATASLAFEIEGPRVRADGAPLHLTPGDQAAIAPERYRLNYRRDWRGPEVNAGPVRLAVWPHLGVAVGSDGVTPRAGAQIDIGERLSGLAPEGYERFGDRGRWYLFAAGDGRSVGYNFVRSREGDLARAGLSQDRGSYMGDAQAGVAWRRGDLQASFGYVYRKHKVHDLRPSRGLERSASESMVALQLSIRPDW